MAQITGGLIAYEDGIKKAEEYTPPKKIRVELRFDTDPDEDTDAALLHVMNKAQAMVQEKLGITGPTETSKRTTKKTEKKPGESEPAPGPSVAETQEENIRRAAQSSKNAGKAVAEATDADKAKAAYAAKANKDPAAIEEETPATEVEDALSDLGGDEELTLAPVTDADLNAAVKARNVEIKAPVKIRELAAEYNGGPGHTLAEIPQEKRHEFLGKLKALKA